MIEAPPVLVPDSQAEILHLASLQNTMILLKSASCSFGSAPCLRSLHQSHKVPLLTALLGAALDRESEKRIVIACQGRKDLNIVVDLIKSKHQQGDPEIDSLVIGLEGHADIVEFREAWINAFATHRILVTSSQSLLFLFSYGILRMNQISHLIFDDCTLSNANHPYCVIMRTFYLPERARLLGSDEIPWETEPNWIESYLPRIVGFADWSLERVEEGFMQKRNRLAKLLSYVRLFQCVIRPLDASLRAPENFSWMSFEEIVSLKDSGCFQQFRTVVLAQGKSSLQNKLETLGQLLDEARFESNDANILVFVRNDSLPFAERLLNQHYDVEILSPSSISPSIRRRIFLSPNDQSEFAIIPYFLQQQTSQSLSHIYIVEPFFHPSLLLTLMAYSNHLPICSLRESTIIAIQEQALEMNLWLLSVGAGSPVDSIPFRKLRAFIGAYEAIAKSAYLLADSSPIHQWIRKTGAIINTNTSIPMLLCVCSYLPHVGSSGTGLAIQTVAVKRVNDEAKELDKERHFYMTNINLPPCLDKWIPSEKLHFRGPLTPNRYSSQTLAAVEALKLFHSHGIIDDNLVVNKAILKVFEIEDNCKPELDYNPFENETIDEDSFGSSSIQELIPYPFQNTMSWRNLQNDYDHAATNAEDNQSEPSKEPFYCYAFNFNMSIIDEMDRKKPVGIKTGHDESLIFEEEDLLPVDTLIHLCDESFMNTSNASRGLAIITREPLVTELRPVELRIGATVILKGILELVNPEQKGLLLIDQDELRTLKEFQAITFGAICTKNFVLKIPKTEEGIEYGNEDEEEDLIGPKEDLTIPFDKQNVFFVGMAIKSDSGDLGQKLEMFNLERTFEGYQRFCLLQGSRIGGQLRPDGAFIPTQWSLDWITMKDVCDPNSRINLLELIQLLKEFEAKNKDRIDAIGPVPKFEFPNDPSREPLIIDFITFALRRLLLYVPYNGLYYRAKQLETDLVPDSQFESKTLPECKSYADYVRLKYGLEVKHPEESLVRVKRVENYSSLSRWLLNTSKSITRRQRPNRQEQNKSDLIPEFVQCLPIPYALVRMMILLPKATYDIERQALIHEFYQLRLPKCLQDNCHFDIVPSVLFIDSLTGPTASLTYDFERLEILGDSVLKLLASIDVFLGSPTTGEGKLSSKRQDIICNATLYKVATSLEIYRYSRLTPFFAKLWCPPDLRAQFDEGILEGHPYIDFVFDEGQQRWKLIWAADERAGKRSALHYLLPNGDLIDKGKDGNHVVLSGAARHLRHKTAPSSTPVLTRFGHAIPPKCLADLIESIIGAVYFAGGYEGTIGLLRGFGIMSDKMLSYRNIEPSDALGSIIGDSSRNAIPILPSQPKILVPSISTSSKYSNFEPYIPSEDSYPFEEIEAILGYKFKCRRLLFVAMTHSSVDVTNSNERLEWLGDAILDWVITKYYYENYKDEKMMTPARITSCRQAAVCNEAFSRIAVHYGMHKYLRIDGSFLQQEIAQYVQAVMDVEMGPDAEDPEGPLTALSWNTKYSTSIDNPDSDPIDGTSAADASNGDQHAKGPKLTIPPAPKAIGDLFEGIAGAVIIDLQFDIEAFAQIYMPLIRWYLDRHADPYDLPENPISDFWHDYLAAGVPPSAIEFRYCQPEEVQQRLLQQQQEGNPHARLPERASTATCQVLVRGRVVAEATAPNRELARKFATRQAVIYIRTSGWKDFLS